MERWLPLTWKPAIMVGLTPVLHKVVWRENQGNNFFYFYLAIIGDYFSWAINSPKFPFNSN